MGEEGLIKDLCEFLFLLSLLFTWRQLVDAVTYNTVSATDFGFGLEGNVFKELYMSFGCSFL